MLCSDPLVGAFKRYGYNVVRLPSTQFTPLLLLERDGRRGARAIGPIGQSLPAAAALPEVHRDDPAPDLDVTTTSELRGQVAASFLGPVLALMGAGAHAAVSLAGARSVVLALRGVRRDWVALADVADYLESGTGSGSHHVREAAIKDRLFVVTAVLKSEEFSLGLDQSVAEAISGAAPAGPVSISLGQSAGRAGSSVVSFRGGEPLSFAFQAVQLLYQDGQYVDYATARGLSGFALTAQAGGPTEGMLSLDDDLVEIAGPG